MEETQEHVVDDRSEGEKWDELLQSLVGENVMVFHRMEMDPTGQGFQGKLSKHLSGIWRVQMPAERRKLEDGQQIDLPMREVHFSTNGLAKVIVMPRLSLVGGA